ncbi:hypothetical protein G6F57_023090 [Rhizopus arrhizus]|nr:hypothetical protein G6F57_023090 [Rhizopus arrhizus]
MLSEQSKNTPKLKLDYLKEQYQRSKKRLLCFDYDGTLTPIQKTPMAAVPPKDMLKKSGPKRRTWFIYAVSMQQEMD